MIMVLNGTNGFINMYNNGCIMVAEWLVWMMIWTVQLLLVMSIIMADPMVININHLLIRFNHNHYWWIFIDNNWGFLLQQSWGWNQQCDVFKCVWKGMIPHSGLAKTMVKQWWKPLALVPHFQTNTSCDMQRWYLGMCNHT